MNRYFPVLTLYPKGNDPRIPSGIAQLKDFIFSLSLIGVCGNFGLNRFSNANIVDTIQKDNGSALLRAAKPANETP
jgi:hypothetical protein